MAAQKYSIPAVDGVCDKQLPKGVVRDYVDAFIQVLRYDGICANMGIVDERTYRQ